MKTLEEVFSSKEQKELLDKYADACLRQYQTEVEIKSLRQALLETLPIKRGVWFKYRRHSGVIKSILMYNDLETVCVRYNTKGLEDVSGDDWMEINLIADLEKIQIIPNNECIDRHPDSNRHSN